MPVNIKQYAFLDKFTCTGAKCEATCCIGWGMQVDLAHTTLYQEEAPELMDAITTLHADSTEAFIMKRHQDSGYCVKFEDGLCGIQKRYGEAFLGDACHFFPRITRQLGEETLMAATLSCPEITRLALFGDNPFELVDTNIDRLPSVIKNYLPGTLSAEDAITITQMFLTLTGDTSLTPEAALSHLITVSKSLDGIDTSRWQEAIPFLLRTAESRILEASSDNSDPFRLLQALAGLIVSTHKPYNPRLMQVVSLMERALDATINWKNMEIIIGISGFSAAFTLHEAWEKAKTEAMSHGLRRWLQTQLAMANFPFVGVGSSLYERITLIAVRFATVKLALMSHLCVYGALPDDNAMVAIVQGLSRFLDHLSDPTLSLKIYSEAGWTRESRLLSVVG